MTFSTQWCRRLHYDLGCYLLPRNKGSIRLYGGVKLRLVTLTCWREHPYWMKALTYVEMTGSFRQDIAVIHNTRRTNDFFMANNVILLHHPACLPNPKFLGWMAREVSEMDVNSKHEAIFTTFQPAFCRQWY